MANRHTAPDTPELRARWGSFAFSKDNIAKANKFIAHHLDLSESTVKLHIHHIISKLGVSNRTEAAIAYLAVDQVDLSGIAP